MELHIDQTPPPMNYAHHQFFAPHQSHSINISLPPSATQLPSQYSLIDMPTSQRSTSPTHQDPLLPKPILMLDLQMNDSDGNTLNDDNISVSDFYPVTQSYVPPRPSTNYHHNIPPTLPTQSLTLQPSQPRVIIQVHMPSPVTTDTSMPSSYSLTYYHQRTNFLRKAQLVALFAAVIICLLVLLSLPIRLRIFSDTYWLILVVFFLFMLVHSIASFVVRWVQYYPLSALPSHEVHHGAFDAIFAEQSLKKQQDQIEFSARFNFLFLLFYVLFGWVTLVFSLLQLQYLIDLHHDQWYWLLPFDILHIIFAALIWQQHLLSQQSIKRRDFYYYGKIDPTDEDKVIVTVIGKRLGIHSG